jgi:hypothetical protein
MGRRVGWKWRRSRESGGRGDGERKEKRER